MVIEHSFMKYSYTARIYIYIYTYIYTYNISVILRYYVIFCGCNLTVHHACINKYSVKPRSKCRYLKAVLLIVYLLDI